MTIDGPGVRLDRWLWAARFYKSRSLAAHAVTGGKVQLNGIRAKPAKAVRVGDRLVVRAGHDEWTISVTALSERRGPATEARTLYEETAASRLAREEKAAQRRAERAAATEFSKGRPTKRERRQLIRFNRDNQ